MVEFWGEKKRSSRSGHPPCYARFGGGSVSGFRMDSGVRQGCPLSPLLYVVVLRRLAAAVPSSVPRAYADDTAIVLADLARDARRLQPILTGVSGGPRLALPENYGHPFGADYGGDPARPSGLVPPWTAVQVRDAVRYLGFMLGRRPVLKAWQRIRDWDWASLGLQYATRVWNAYVMPTLLFVAQLEPPPPEVVKAQAAVLRKAAHCRRTTCSTSAAASDSARNSVTSASTR